jgi:AcrR family transcriptional regulator
LIERGRPQEGVSRTERRRARTRASLLGAAQRLMQRQGVEATSVAQITEAADVGLGTFYLHFESKVEMLAAVVTEMVRAHRTEVERITAAMADPAQIVATAIRFTLHHVVRDPLWSWFLLRSGLPAERMREAFGEHAMGHVRDGLRAGRFLATDLDVVASFLTGAIAGVVSERVDGRLGPDADRMAAQLLLITLGVPRDEAASIAAQPLPPLEH